MNKILFGKTTRLAFLFQLGLALLFLVNALSAWFSPSEFTELIQNNALASSIASSHFWITIIGINDSLLFLLILTGTWKKGIAVWASIWILLVLYVTNATGFELTDFVEHVGILSLIVYYFFAFE